MAMKPLLITVMLAVPVFAASAQTTSSERLRRESAEAVDAIRSWTTEQKSQYIEKMRNQYEELEPEIENLKSRAETARKEAKTELEKYVDDLDVKKARLDKRLDEFTTASKAALGDLKLGVDEAWKDLRKAYNKAKTRFK